MIWGSRTLRPRLAGPPQKSRRDSGGTAVLQAWAPRRDGISDADQQAKVSALLVPWNPLGSSWAGLSPRGAHKEGAIEQQAAHSGATVRAGSPSRRGTTVRAGSPSRRGTTVRAGSPSRRGTTVRAGSPSRRGTTVRAGSPSRRGTTVRAGSPSRRGTTVRAGSPSRRGTTVRAGSPSRRGTTVRAGSPSRQGTTVRAGGGRAACSAPTKGYRGEATLRARSAVSPESAPAFWRCAASCTSGTCGSRYKRWICESHPKDG